MNAKANKIAEGDPNKMKIQHLRKYIKTRTSIFIQLNKTMTAAKKDTEEIKMRKDLMKKNCSFIITENWKSTLITYHSSAEKEFLIANKILPFQFHGFRPI